ncbi:DUF3581 family protein [Pseudomaricurvus sp. HS19]|uniref:DUF3581 family protein n=1 Tax=Pseudomaricurvus sp. HS19 TaxID=2692626 RepID=UPI001369BABC|nr:DUF3581 family protein [Pseudomaricurvus sp. HS19]MYM62604.1 DUF3581 family protein [Pseudomaricurvus sp. HS19]
MQLEQYYTPRGDGFSFSREQASRFAKGVADDFNPIHDTDAKRFCVPGDLLFSLALEQLGLFESMEVKFADMVSDGVTLHFNQDDSRHIDIADAEGRTYLSVATAGENNANRELARDLAAEYAAFSGKTFPHVLVPLWKEHGVMVNPARPLVIYESMAIQLHQLTFSNLHLELAGAHMEVNGKRGNARLEFEFRDGDKIIGRGEKRIVLSGLKPYEEDAVEGLVAFYEQRKTDLA